MLFSNLTELGSEVGGPGGLNLGGIGWWDWEGGNVNGTIVKWSSSSVIGWGSSDESWGVMEESSWVVEDWSSNGGTGNGNWSDSMMSDSNWSNWGWADWEVGGSNTESVDGVSNIVHALDKSVSINVAVSSTNNTIGGLGLLLGRWASSISVGVLAELILSMVLGSVSSWGNNGTWDNELTLGDSQSAGKNNEGLHFD